MEVKENMWFIIESGILEVGKLSKECLQQYLAICRKEAMILLYIPKQGPQSQLHDYEIIIW